MNRNAAGRVSEHMFGRGFDSVLARTLRLADGTPLFLRGLRPADFWFEYGLHLARSQRGSTLRDYALIAATFARFVDSRNIVIDKVTEADIVEYRIRRTEVDAIASNSWAKESTVIQSIFDYANHVGRFSGYPWFQQGRRSALRQPSYYTPETRGISEDEWLQFKQIGLLGRDLNGAPNPEFKTVWMLRNLAGAELALATGLRLQEFSTLLVPEVMAPTTASGGAHVTIKATAKNMRERTILIPSGVLSHVQAYVRTDRAALIAHLRGASHAPKHSRFVVDEWRPGDRVLVGELDGTRRSFQLKEMSPALRAATFTRTDTGMEPLALFVNSWGRMTSKATWHRVFKNASNYVASYSDTLPAARNVHPHTLRHTFARRYLAYLRRASRSADYSEEWGDIDEVVIVQRVLGHASLSTTSRYLSGDPVSGIVEELFYQSTNTDENFAEMIERSRAEGRADDDV